MPGQAEVAVGLHEVRGHQQSLARRRRRQGPAVVPEVLPTREQRPDAGQDPGFLQAHGRTSVTSPVSHGRGKEWTLGIGAEPMLVY